MSKRPQTRTIDLSLEEARFVDAKVASGAYASTSDVVCDALEALAERDARLDEWLTRDVASVYDQMKSQPQTAIPAEEVFAGLRARRRASS